MCKKRGFRIQNGAKIKDKSKKIKVLILKKDFLCGFVA